MRDPSRSLGEITFAILFQRKELREKAGYGELERSLPKDVRKIVEDDWNSFIRAADGEGYAIAYEKAVVKNFPGMYRLIEACEYLFEWAFHRAAAWLFGNTPTAEDEEKCAAVFDFADRLRQMRAVERAQREGAARNRSEVEAIAQPVNLAPSDIRTPSPGLSRCTICGETVALSGWVDHVRKAHRNWRQIAAKEQAQHRKQIASRLRFAPSSPPPSTTVAPPLCRPASPPSPAFVITPVTQDKWAHLSSSERTAFGLCLFCDHRPMPGEFTCYHCRPE